MFSINAARVTLPASDLGRARKFYEEVLSFKVLEEDPAGIRFGSGGAEIGVYPSSYAGTNKATAAEFDVDDIDAQMKNLRDAGVTFEEYDFPGLKTENGVATLGPDKGAWFKDTEGNILALVQRSH